MARSNYIVRGGGDFSGLYKELNIAQKRMNKFKSGMGTVLKGVAGLFGGLAIGSLGKSFAETAMRTETLEVAMLSVGRASGYASDELQKAKTAIREKGIAEQESMQILTRFMQAQLDVADASKLARVAQDAAVIANVNSSEAAEQMTEAIAKQRPELLSAFGMTKNLNVVLSEYAAVLQKDVKEMTEAERKQAMLNYILSEGTKIAGTYEASMDAVGKKIGSLPRHWQDLQNAIATPLMLPGIGVAVDAITNALQRATAWADANAMTLQYWGQVVSSAVGGVVNIFSWLTNVLRQNWGMIQFVGTAMLAYAAITRTVAVATQTMALASALLNGTLVTKSPILGTLNAIMFQFKAQTVMTSGAMIGMSGASGVLTGALLTVRNAIVAIHAVIGPLGWIIMAISALLGIGTVAWGKYSSSVMKSNQKISSAQPDMSGYTNSIQKSQKALGNLGKGSGEAAKGQKKLADGIKKADKAAKGSLAGFDEINTLQQDMGDADASGLGDIGSGGVGDIGGLGDVEMPDMSIPDMGGMDGGFPGLGDMMDGLEMAKPTLKGFWEWIKQGAGNVWEKVKEKWTQFTDWVKSWDVWDAVKEKWEQFKEWASPYWESVKEKWNQFKDWVSEKFSNLWEGIKNKWNSFKEWASEIWAGTKKKWSEFKDWVSDGFSKAWDKTKATWNTFTTWASNMWESTKKKWNDFKENTKRIFGDMWTSIKTTFSSTKTWFGDTFGGAWNKIKEVFSISNIRTTFNTVWNTIKGIFRSVPDWFRTQFSTAWNNVKNVFSSGGKVFTGIKDGIASTFRTIVNGLINGINRIIRTPFNAINNMLNRIRNVSILGAKPFSRFISHNAIRTPQIPRLAKGGITNGEMLAVVGDNPGGREVVSPLDTLQSMLVEAVGTAMTNNNSGNDRPINIEVVSKIGDTEFGRESIKAINNYQDRMGQTLLNV